MKINIGKTVEKRCEYCGKKFYPRIADVNRGWGKFCSKSCKANSQYREEEANAGILDIGFLEDDF